MFYLILAFLLLPSPVHAEQYSEVEGVWSGAIEVYGDELAIHITFSYSDGELDGTIDIPQQQAFNLPIEVTRAEGEEMNFQFETGSGPAVFHGVWSASARSIVGEFEQIGERFPFYLNKQSRSGMASGNQTEVDLMIPSRAGEIGGTLLLQSEPAPLIILLTGSGSQDRDETVAGFRVFNVLSRELYQNGFSSFRYDDRGIGASTGDTDATLEELAEDLVDVVSYLKREHGDRFTELILLGHSQGGLVASIAAAEAEPAGLIMMATPFLSVDEIINQQIIKISEAQQIPEEVMNLNLEFQERVYEVVRTGGSWEPVEESLRERLTEQINQLPEAQVEALGDVSGFIQSQINRQLSAAKSDWFRSLIEFQPEEVLNGLNVPVLALFGEKDMQVFPEDNIKEVILLREASENRVEYRVIPDANHLFQKAETGMPSEYGMLEREFAEGFVASIVEWLGDIK
jgi:pimeloyl-ACP methyl ester carboxylesterase